MINKVGPTTFTVPASFLGHCEKKDPPNPLEKSALEPAAPNTTSRWVKVLDFFLFVFSWIKDNLCCWLFDEDEETRERKIDQLQQFLTQYTDPNMTVEQFTEAFNGLESDLQKEIKNKMPTVIRSCRPEEDRDPQEINECIEYILTENPKFEIATKALPPKDKRLVFGEALQGVLHRYGLSEVEST